VDESPARRQYIVKRMIKRDKFELRRWLFALILVLFLVGSYFVYPWLRTRVGRVRRLGEWLNDPSAHADWSIQTGKSCGTAPFIMPTNGYVGFIWGDSFRPGNQHQGIDIFGGDVSGSTPVLATYGGYLTRLPDWKSTVIIRIPVDPLNPDRQVWTYYTHMADQNGSSYISPQFTPGTSEMRVEAGTFLGYQGDFSGDPGNPVGVHLHFSIVQDDGTGSFRNELKIENTLDPSPYLGLSLNASKNPTGIVVCEDEDYN
jgi:murein DD-endopeptidase MepM/ murein hydrolase activator NlpD